MVGLTVAFAALATLTGCTTERHTATVGNYRIISGHMGPVAQRWEIMKASVAGWEVVGSTENEEYGILVLHKDK